jgi:hypothetical protein
LFKLVQRSNNKSEKVPIPLDWKTLKATDKWQNIVLPSIDLLTKDIDDLTPEDFYDADFERPLDARGARRFRTTVEVAAVSACTASKPG